VANSSFTQDYNRYSYCRNNPLSYTDPNGEFILFAILAGAMYGMYQAINTNGGFDAGKVIGGGIIGAAAGGLGAVVGAGAGFGFTGGLFGGLTSGFASGLTSGTWNSWMQGGSFLDGLGDGIRTGFIAGGIGGLMGGISGGIYAKRHQGNFWTGDGIKFDVLASGPAPSSVEIGEGMEFTSDYAIQHGRDYLDGGAGGVSEYRVGPIPDGYRREGDLVYNKYNQRTAGTFEPLSPTSRYGNMYLYKEAFISKEKLYLVMGHEYLHAAFLYNGMKHDPVRQGVTPAHRSIYHWEYSQASAWNYNMRHYDYYYKGYELHPDFPYSKFSFTKIRPKVPW